MGALWFIVFMQSVGIIYLAKKYYDVEKKSVSEKKLKASVKALGETLAGQLAEYSKNISEQLESMITEAARKATETQLTEVMVKLRKEAEETNRALRLFLTGELSKFQILQTMRMANLDSGIDAIATKTSAISAILHRLGKFWERVRFWKRNKNGTVEPVLAENADLGVTESETPLAQEPPDSSGPLAGDRKLD